jgi:predicted nucleic acid-binding protein
VSIYLADTSAWSHALRKRAPAALKARFNSHLIADEIAICDMVQWELLHSTNNHAEFLGRRAQLNALRQCPIGVEDWQRAFDIGQTLAERGGSLHRSIAIQDTLIAVAAESAGLTLLHYDSDYETIAGVTGQAQEWIAPRGSL